VAEGGQRQGWGDDDSRRPLYRRGCRRPPRRNDPTAVAHGGRLPRGPTPCSGPLEATLPLWVTAAAVAHGGWLLNLKKFQMVV
jgi:hypothetical protein